MRAAWLSILAVAAFLSMHCNPANAQDAEPPFQACNTANDKTSREALRNATGILDEIIPQLDNPSPDIQAKLAFWFGQSSADAAAVKAVLVSVRTYIESVVFPATSSIPDRLG